MFLLFAGERDTPNGGWNDCRGQWVTLDGAIEWATTRLRSPNEMLDNRWWHVVDSTMIDRAGPKLVTDYIVAWGTWDSPGQKWYMWRKET